jgi:hypothetical protein
MTDLGNRYHAAMNRLAKWRTVFAGWQLGTRAKGDPGADAVRDHREVTILLRVESNALAALLITKGVFTAEEWQTQLIEEANHLSKSFEQRFPGFKAFDDGMVITPHIAKDTTATWYP